MLYISVSIIFGAPHLHSDAASVDQCASCAWQAGSVVDLPITEIFIRPPTPTILLECALALPVYVYVLEGTQSRGPPVSCS